jgi:hypothetical protein
VPVPPVAPRTQAVEPLNGELRHGLAQNRVDQGRARCEARRFEGDREAETFGGTNDGLCGVDCFSLLIRSAPLPKEIKLSDGIVKFNGQQDPRIWLDDFITAVEISGGSRDNALQLLSLHLKHNARAWLNNLTPGADNFGKRSSPTSEALHDDLRRSKNYAYACREPEKT